LRTQSRPLFPYTTLFRSNEEGRAEGVEVQLVFDTMHDHYQLWYIGWQGERRIRGCVLQVDTKDGKIWIQYDGTETGLAGALVQRSEEHTSELQSRFDLVC